MERHSQVVQVIGKRRPNEDLKLYKVKSIFFLSGTVDQNGSVVKLWSCSV